MDNSSKDQAYDILAHALGEIRRLPRFSGQTQLANAMRRLLNLSLWRKS